MSPLDVAVAELAAGVVEEPLGSNRGVPFTRYAFLGEEPGAWCARFVRWCYITAGQRLPGNRWLIGNVMEMRDALAEHGGVLPVGVPWEPGDLLFWKDRGASDAHIGGHHVSILRRVELDRIRTVDGNWRNRVDDVVRTMPTVKASLICAARWPLRAVA